MCNFKSLVLLEKDVCILLDTDSHSEILRKFNIPDKKEVPDFVKIEIIPPTQRIEEIFNDSGEYLFPLEEWKYVVDQDILPPWYVEEIDRPRAFEAVKNFFDTYKEELIYYNFKVGDLVTAKLKAKDFYSITNDKMTLARVLYRDFDIMKFDRMEIEVLEHSTQPHSQNEKYVVNPKYFKLVKRA